MLCTHPSNTAVCLCYLSEETADPGEGEATGTVLDVIEEFSWDALELCVWCVCVCVCDFVFLNVLKLALI